ncbi:MAG: hypothetical protein IJ228_00735 [Succinivibrio sp.]|nr:hypothetical protein [Succinivibrio sp.]
MLLKEHRAREIEVRHQLDIAAACEPYLFEVGNAIYYLAHYELFRREDDKSGSLEALEGAAFALRVIKANFRRYARGNACIAPDFPPKEARCYEILRDAFPLLKLLFEAGHEGFIRESSVERVLVELENEKRAYKPGDVQETVP